MASQNTRRTLMLPFTGADMLLRHATITPRYFFFHAMLMFTPAIADTLRC